MHILSWAYENGCEGDESTCSGAAGRGDLPMLQFLRQRDCPWDTLTCSAAASHLPVLQWARTNGCPWDDHVTRQAAQDGNLETLQWARSQGAPWHVNRAELEHRATAVDAAERRARNVASASAHWPTRAHKDGHRAKGQCSTTVSSWVDTSNDSLRTMRFVLSRGPF
jgi:hypothetical protein